MRTKALLLAAAIGAVSLGTAMAQVYSVNIVGYVNSTLPRGFTMIQNPLVASPGTLTDQPLSTAIPSLPVAATIYKYNHTSGQYDLATWDSDFQEWDNPTMQVRPGEGFFFYHNNATPITVTFVGEVPTGTLQVPLYRGFNMIGSMVPQAGKVQTDLGYVPNGNETIYQYVNSTGQYDLGTYDPDFQEWDKEPVVAVGEAFWVYRSAGDGFWTRTFNVN